VGDQFEALYDDLPATLTPEQASALRNRARTGENKAALARELGISRAALYVYLAAGGATVEV
jgi:DNA invertase Pin-like site-specific DNA recombinase